MFRVPLSFKTCAMGPSDLASLQPDSLKSGEGWGLTQGHTDGKQQNQDLNLGPQSLSAMLFLLSP